MKKLLALLLALLLVLSLAACGTGDDGPKETDPPKTGTADTDNETRPDEDDEPTKPDTTEPPETDAATEPAAPEEPDPFGPEVLERISSVNEDTAKGKGTCGENLTWYYLDNLLVIRGTGEMEDYSTDNGLYYNDAPWSMVADQVELVYLEDGVTSVGEQAFCEMNVLRAVYLPDSVTSIRLRAFYFCQNLHYVRWPANLPELGGGAFWATDLNTSFSFPEGTTKIEVGVFYSAGLTSVELPDGLTEIGGSAFCDNELTSITLPDSLTTIGEDAFYGNPITEVTIPASVTRIERNAFSRCPLTTITFLGDAPEMGEYNHLLIGLEEGVTIQYSGEGFEPYIETYFLYNWVKQ